MAHNDSSTARLRAAGLVLYVLAAIVLLLGAYMGLAFANARAAISGATIAFQTPQLTPLWDALASGLAFVGIVLFVISLIMSALLTACGLTTYTGLRRGPTRRSALTSSPSLPSPSASPALPASPALRTGAPACAPSSRCPALIEMPSPSSSGLVPSSPFSDSLQGKTTGNVTLDGNMRSRYS